jgi:NADH pyrophosphatase NudC (nudix superfamily)
MMNESQPNKTGHTTGATDLTSIRIYPESEGLIVKCSCEAEVSALARFCPHCGGALAPELSEAATVVLSEAATGELPQGGWSTRGQPELLTEATTLRETDWIPPLPAKYRIALELGTAPELILWEMFKSAIELRCLLEELVDSLSPAVTNSEIEKATLFLGSHCAGCGEPVHQVKTGTPAVCIACRNM